MSLDFPVMVGPLHPHTVFDFLAFLVGGQLFWRSVRRARGEAWTPDATWAVVAGCALGAFLGAKLIVLLEDPARTLALLRDPAFLVSGKSIVGALLGGLAGVEIAKRLVGVARSTGDHFAVPVAVGLAVGRVGCFLSGLDDDAYGVATTLPWGVDFGDGIARHPTQIYEAAFALALAAVLVLGRDRFPVGGDRFRFLMVAYFAFRFGEEFVRVAPRPYLGLTVYQVACLAGLAYYLRDAGTRSRLARAVRLTA